MNSENKNIVIKAENVCKSFSRKNVLKDINITLREGELIAATGENGSGKSTLLKILTGILKPDNGKVIMTGKVGFCPQEQLIFNSLTVNENFRYFSGAYGFSNQNPAEYENQKFELMRRFRFEQYKDVITENLSGGTKQKLNLCIALIHSPAILLLDEPYSGFEWETYLRFWDYAKDLKEKGVCIIVVSHFIYEREKFDRIYELNGGVLI